MTLTSDSISFPPEPTLDTLLEAVRLHRPDLDRSVILAAHAFAAKVHEGQVRKSGAPFVTHPIAVASILAELETDVETIAAGLLHDTVEDTGAAIEDIASAFGQEIAHLVDGVTKLKSVGRDVFTGEPIHVADPDSPVDVVRAKQRQDTAKRAANLRKIFLAMARDLRVFIIKLADRLHNMRTLYAKDEPDRKRIALETLEVYAPLAHRIGIWQVKWELEDLAFRYAMPDEYLRLAAQVDQTRGDRQGEVDEAITVLKERLEGEGLKDAIVTGRPKHLYSIYVKMHRQELDFQEIYDLTALRVIVHTRPQCYHTLGIISALWVPMHGMYSDYIARSKSNLYQSLHLKVIGPRSKPLEIQIRTWEMHRTAEFGVAAHWAYKEKGEGGKADDQFERKLGFLRQQLFDWQADAADAGAFLRAVVDNLLADQVFVFTPKSDVIDLPSGATAIDFAYRIHSDVGNKTVGARVNGRMVPLSYQFKNGDVVEIITRSNAAPSRDWLALAKTGHARSKIKAFLKRLLHSENVQIGREILLKEAERLGLDAHALLKDDLLRTLAPIFNVPNEVELLAGVGYGSIAVGSVLNKLAPAAPVQPKGLQVGRGRSDEAMMRVTAGEVDNIMVRRAQCCLPIPGDPVVGYVTRGKGMSLHHVGCTNAVRFYETEPERMFPVAYGAGDNQVYSVGVRIQTLDRVGLLADIGNIFGEMKANITQARTQSHMDGTATIEVSVEVRDVEHYERLTRGMQRLPDVISIDRAYSGRVAAKD